jgi:hypothetical protein
MTHIRAWKELEQYSAMAPLGVFGSYRTVKPVFRTDLTSKVDDCCLLASIEPALIMSRTPRIGHTMAQRCLQALLLRAILMTQRANYRDGKRDIRAERCVEENEKCGAAPPCRMNCIAAHEWRFTGTKIISMK